MRIGSLHLSNNLFLAPMAGITDHAFRRIARSFGAALCYSEMVSANGLTRNMDRSMRYLVSSADDRPLGVQLFGSDPAVLAEAAVIAEHAGADLIDINMGCPVKKVVKTGAGAALMRDPAAAGRIVAAVRRVTGLPLTVKLRSGWSPAAVTVVEVARRVEEMGADALALHPRTAVQGYRGSADWNLVEAVKQSVSVPVIGSGDIWTPGDVAHIQRRTGCDAVMIARGSLGNPWIFQQCLAGSLPAAAPGPSPSEREETIRRHCELSMGLYGGVKGVVHFRKHLLWYTRGLPGGAAFRKAVADERDVEMMLAALHHFLRSGDD